jgi:hypothetical protein
MNRLPLSGYRRMLWVCCPDFSETLFSSERRRNPLKIVTTAIPKRRDNRPTPGGDIPEDVIDTITIVFCLMYG